jgi:hypothetical protein
MPWISLAATRCGFEHRLAEKFARPGYAESSMRRVTADDGLAALLTGNEKYIKGEVKRAQAVLAKRHTEWEPPPAEVMSKAFGIAVLCALAGTDPTPIIRAIAEAKGYEAPRDRSLQLIARRISGLEAAPTAPVEKPGHVSTDAQWYRVVKQAPAPHAFDLALTPDHPRWPLLADFVLPLGWQLALERNAAAPADELKTLLRLGAYPERRGDVVYERTNERADLDEATETDEEADDGKTSEESATFNGFDAVEERADKLYAYYYLGMRWQVPLYFQEDLNAYDFLAHVAADWRTVHKAVGGKQWAQLERRRAECIYVIVYDAHETYVPEGHLEAAAEHYKLQLEARDLTEV